MSLIANTDLPTGKRKLTQKPAAFALAAGLLAVPLVPVLLEAVVPERSWDSTAPGESDVEIVSAEGIGIQVTAPGGWEAQDNGDSAVLRSEGAAVLIQVYDRGGRDPESVAQRLMRANRVQGMPSALDGGRIGSADGDFTGDTCVVVTDDLTGTCAYLFDEDVVVSVIALGDADHPALPIAEVVGPLARSVR
ncbi:hypothetical protein BH10ACT9_BH10ACT9_24790 [soil metagenome]